MSPQQARARDLAVNACINALITAVVALFLTRGIPGLVATTLNAKESVAAHAADVQRIDNRLERVLDVLCEREPKARACSASASSGEIAR